MYFRSPHRVDAEVAKGAQRMARPSKAASEFEIGLEATSREEMK